MSIFEARSNWIVALNDVSYMAYKMQDGGRAREMKDELKEKVG